MEEKSDYKISSTENNGILEVVMKGKLTKSSADEIINKFSDIVKAKKIQKVLVDMRKLDGRLGITQTYALVRTYRLHMYKSIFAYVDIPENADYQNYHETTAANAGIMMKWFTDIDAARVWLKGNKYDNVKKRYHKTAQRTAILEYLKDNTSHPNITDIYKHVSEKLSIISMTTVYNTVNALIKEGVIQELAVRHQEGMRFDPILPSHDHFICNICGKVINVELDVDHSLLINEKQKRQYGIDIRETRITFYGMCSDCKKKDNKSAI
jgi:Fur family transcriptional regulator, peroxide stress response regulator